MYFFNGQVVESPAVMSRVIDTAMLDQGVGVGNVLALIGKAAGGKPNTSLRFSSPDDARQVLASGELLDAVVRAFNPSSDTGAPTIVTAIRVDPAVQSTLQLRDGAAAVVITLTSEGYGLRENQVKVKVEAATGGRGLKLTTQRGNDYYTADNVLRNVFKIRYTGAEASAVMTVNGTQVVLQAPSGTPVATIALATYPTVQQLVDRIAAVADFTCTVEDGNGAKATVQSLDFVTAQNVKSADYVARADLQAAVDWFNSAGEGYVTAARAADVGTLPAVLAFTYMASGTDGSTTNTEWTNAFSTLQAEDVQWVVPVSSDPAIHAMAVAHAAYMTNTARRERHAMLGAPAATSDAAAIVLAKAIGSDRAGLVHLGGYDYNEIGALTLYPPYIVAAMVAAMFCGSTPGTALTSKSLRLVGLERKLRNPADTDPLLRGGVMPLEDTPTGYRVVRSISTWLTDSKFNRVELSCSVAMDYTARAVRDALAGVVGAKGLPTTLGIAVSATETALKELAKSEASGGPGVLAGDDVNPPYRNIRAKLVGDRIEVSFEASPVIPINYVGVTIFAKPYSGSASAA